LFEPPQAFSPFYPSSLLKIKPPPHPSYHES
jgi:hypothetical protein